MPEAVATGFSIFSAAYCFLYCNSDIFITLLYYIFARKTDSRIQWKKQNTKLKNIEGIWKAWRKTMELVIYSISHGRGHMLKGNRSPHMLACVKTTKGYKDKLYFFFFFNKRTIISQIRDMGLFIFYVRINSLSKK